MESDDKFWSIFWVCVATCVCVSVVGRPGLLVAMFGIPAIVFSRGEK